MPPPPPQLECTSLGIDKESSSRTIVVSTCHEHLLSVVRHAYDTQKYSAAHSRQCVRKSKISGTNGGEQHEPHVVN